MFSQGNSGHSAHVLMPRSSQHFATWYLHQFSGLHPAQAISWFMTTWSRYPILIQSSAVWRNSSSVFTNGNAVYLGHAEQSFPQAAMILSFIL